MVPLRRRSARWTLALLAVTTLALVGCSDDESSSTTTTTRPPSTTAPPSTTVPPEAAEPLPVAWVRQVGGPGNDVLESVTGRDDAVLAAGTTTGLDPAAPLPAGTTAAFVDVVAAADGAPTATTQATQERAATADAIADGQATTSDGGSADPGSTPSVTLACGTTPTAPDASDRPVVGPAGGTDAWCASVGADGALGTAQAVGSDLDDEVRGVAVHSSRSDAAGTPTELGAFAVGRTVGLFPEAKDPTGGYLGEGDALVTRLDETGAISWARQFGTTASDEANAVTTSDDGDAIVGGSTDGRTDGDVGGPIGGTDAWMARIDPRGNLRWLTQFGTTESDRALAVASGGDPRRGTEVFVGAGTTVGSVGTSAALGGTDAMVSAFDASGRQLWAVQLGSTADDEATGVVVDGATIYVTGTTAGEVLGGQRISLTPSATPDSTDPGGGSPDSTAPDTTAPDDTTPPPGGGEDGFLAAIDAETGEVRWVAQFGSTGDERVNAMTRTESGLVVVTGSTTGQLATTPPGGGTDGFMVAFVPPSGGGGAASMV